MRIEGSVRSFIRITDARTDYKSPERLACYLLSEEMAEPANGESYAPLPAEKKTVATVLPRSVAADRRRIRAQSKREEHS
jgi:hypothetical protein